ncbi:MAG: hypothetical protein MZV49_00180 [Rhodopseudomonas palustris]|nr:hypothetical protein [Rhodopseudomonas palustris]
MGSVVLQVATRNADRAKTVFRDLGLLVENAAVSGSQKAWLGRNMLPVLLLLGTICSAAMLVWIFKGMLGGRDWIPVRAWRPCPLRN